MHAADLSAEEHARLTRSWQQAAPLPVVPPERLVLSLTSLRALRGVRQQVRAFLQASAGAAAPDVVKDAVERVIQVLDELTSNALRHGLPPCSLHIGDEPTRWMLAITDSAPGRLPTPALDRPAGAGGYGLYLITELTTAHGVQYDGATKTVWATMAKP